MTASIDTNIWLDLLVFDDAATHRLAALIDSQALRLYATAPMRAELADVLSRPLFAQTPDQQTALLARFDERVTLVPDAPDCRVACRDPDDRKFLDLALSRRFTWLLSRDKALLAARKTALRRFGVNIGTLPDLYRWLDAAIAPPSA